MGQFCLELQCKASTDLFWHLEQGQRWAFLVIPQIELTNQFLGESLQW